MAWLMPDIQTDLSLDMTKPTKWVCAQSDQSLWVAKDLSFLHVDSKDPDQTGRMPLRCTYHFAGFVLRRPLT